MKQGSLPYVANSETSFDAADAFGSDLAATLRERVYRAIRDSADGLTDEEIQRVLEMDGSTERPRRVELLRAQRICDSGERRDTRSGRRAVVWRAGSGLV